VLALAACEKKSDSHPGDKPGAKPTVAVDAGAKPIAAADAAPVAAVADAAPALDAAPATPKPKKPAAKLDHANPAPEDLPTTKPKCPRMPACGIGCPGKMAKDANGCTLCACEKETRPGDMRPDGP
jgi:hypothetical protein